MNMLVSTQSVTISLSDEEYSLLETFAREQGISDIANAVGPLLREYVKTLDALWDEKLARPNPGLDALIAESKELAAAGLTLDLTPDMLEDEVKDHS